MYSLEGKCRIMLVSFGEWSGGAGWAGVPMHRRSEEYESMRK